MLCYGNSATLCSLLVMLDPVLMFAACCFYASRCAAPQVFAFLFSFSFLYPASRLLRDIVLEKELRMREGMRAMGLGSGSLLTSWYLTYLFMVSAQAIMITVLTSRNVFQASCDRVVLQCYLCFVAMHGPCLHSIQAQLSCCCYSFCSGLQR